MTPKIKSPAGSGREFEKLKKPGKQDVYSSHEEPADEQLNVPDKNVGKSPSDELREYAEKC